MYAIPGIISDYAPRYIYNADETGLYFRALPDKTLKVRGEECAGGKKSKLQLTAMLCCNMVGEHEKVLVIGKAAKPRCFKNINSNQLPVTWENRLVDDFVMEQQRTDTDQCDSGSDTDEEVAPAPAKPKRSLAETLQIISEVRDFCLENDVPDSLDMVNQLRDALHAHSFKKRCTSRQTVMNDYLGK